MRFRGPVTVVDDKTTIGSTSEPSLGLPVAFQ